MSGKDGKSLVRHFTKASITGRDKKRWEYHKWDQIKETQVFKKKKKKKSPSLS